LIGSRKIAGKSTVEVQQIIERGLRDGNFILDPHVTVLIQEYGGQGVSVSGEVNRPGKYPIIGSPSLLDIISMAGGFTPLADSHVTIRHKNSDDLVTVTVSASDAKQSLDSDVVLQPGDKVVVPRSGVIYVLGDVGKPGGFPISDNGMMTLLQAVAFAQGPTNTAGLNETKIIRKDGSGHKVANVALKRVMEGKSQDVVLHPGDIVYVPNSLAKAARNRGAAAIVQAAASLAIYAVR
jgi:polysaccharide export outer membrane protein